MQEPLAVTQVPLSIWTAAIGLSGVILGALVAQASLIYKERLILRHKDQDFLRAKFEELAHTLSIADHSVVELLTVRPDYTNDKYRQIVLQSASAVRKVVVLADLYFDELSDPTRIYMASYFALKKEIENNWLGLEGATTEELTFKQDVHEKNKHDLTKAIIAAAKRYSRKQHGKIFWLF